MNSKIRSLLFSCLGLLFGMSVMFIYNTFTAEKKEQPKSEKTSATSDNAANKSKNTHDISGITDYKLIIDYVKKNHQLPEYYITKNEARKLGWNPSEGNLCDVLPGKAIGGDVFGNRERKLPADKKYFEADVNYNCGNRNAARIVFTADGEVYLTENHYKSFKKQ